MFAIGDNVIIKGGAVGIIVAMKKDTIAKTESYVVACAKLVPLDYAKGGMIFNEKSGKMVVLETIEGCVASELQKIGWDKKGAQS
jgi:hypothetical protein